MLIDSHCHLDFPDFASELDAVVGRAKSAGVRHMLTIGTRVRKFDEVLAVAERFPEVTCSIGTHPHYASEERDITLEEIVEQTRNPRVVAIGEVGLDYFYQKSSREDQEAGFRTHIAAAFAFAKSLKKFAVVMFATPASLTPLTSARTLAVCRT